MSVKKELIQFTLVNSTDCEYTIPLMQLNVYSINATTKYSWDITTQNLSCGTGSIVINSVVYSITYSPDLAGLLTALNALGFGFFCSQTIGANTYIYTVDDTNTYGNLTLCATGTTTTTTTSTTTAAPTTTTSTTTSTTTAAPTTTTSTTSTTTTAAPTTSTSTTTSTTTAAPTTTSTTSTTTTVAPTTTSTTTTTTTDVPTTTTSTSTTTTTETSTTTTSTSTTTTTETSTSTTTTTTTAVLCTSYQVNPDLGGVSIEYFDCGGAYLTGTYFTQVTVCAEDGTLNITGGGATINNLGAC